MAWIAAGSGAGAREKSGNPEGLEFSAGLLVGGEKFYAPLRTAAVLAEDAARGGRPGGKEEAGGEHEEWAHRLA